MQKFGYIIIEIIRNNHQEILERRIYLSDTPYAQNCAYPINNNVKDNNIKYNKDDVFNLIINNSSEISEDFYDVLENLELIYTSKLLFYMHEENIEKLKIIIYALYQIYNSNLKYIINKVDRDSLLKLYNICEMNKPKDLSAYYKRTVINNYF